MESKILLKEKVKNKKRRFGSWKEYYPCTIDLGNGKSLNALFTKSQLRQAIYRSNKNIEDLPNTAKFIREFLE